MKNFFKITSCCFVLANITACTPVTAQRGNLLEDYQIADVKINESSVSDVLRLLGSPTTQSTFNNNIWYYIGQETQKRGILDDEVIKERIIEVAFNKEGIVQSIKEIDNERIAVPYTRSKTPTHGNELTFTQQLLGNLGRFNTPDRSATDQ